MSARPAWTLLLVVSGAIAAVATANWADALVTGRPVIYGEGMVAHAAILLGGGNPYADVSGLVSANYPPLYLLLASPDPFHVGRAVTILSSIAVAAIVWWRCAAPPAARGALALTWVALFPVATWGAVVRVDMLAVALTAGGVAFLDGEGWRADPRRAAIGGALLVAAIWAKPTAALPAIAVLAYVALRMRRAAMPAIIGGAIVGAVALGHAATLGLGDVWTHVVVWNAALAWTADMAVLVIVVGIASLALPLIAAAERGALRGLPFAYVAGAAGVVLLGGREGASINYLLDLCAATMYALASVGPGIAPTSRVPLLAMAQLVVAVTLFSPFGIVPGRPPATGAWLARERADLVRDLPRGRAHLVEESGLLIATGHAVVADDVFLWSRLVERGRVDARALLDRVSRGEFATVVTEADLSAIDEGTFAAARWHPSLRTAVLERYRLARTLDPSASGRPVLWVYEPR